MQEISSAKTIYENLINFGLWLVGAILALFVLQPLIYMGVSIVLLSGVPIERIITSMDPSNPMVVFSLGLVLALCMGKFITCLFLDGAIDAFLRDSEVPGWLAWVDYSEWWLWLPILVSVWPFLNWLSIALLVTIELGEFYFLYGANLFVRVCKGAYQKWQSHQPVTAN